MILYKYRNFSNFKFILDIFLNNQLYASNFKNLNDPMEGYFNYSDKISNDDLKMIIEEKNNYNILSLSEEKNNLLMWSHYCDSHTGFVVGVKVRAVDSEDIKEINYTDTLNTELGNAKDILSRKLNLWEYEKEHRIFTKKKHVKVEIVELIFGVKTSSKDKGLLTQVARKFNENIEITTLKTEDLDLNAHNNQNFINF